MRFLTRATCALMLLPLLADAAWSNPYAGMVQQLACQNFARWQGGSSAAAARWSSAAVAVKSSGGTKALAEANYKALEEYLARLVPAMKPSPQVAHLPQEHPVAVEEEKRWTHFYALAKTRLRPRVQYRWSSNATGEQCVLALTEEHLAALQLNLDVLMWYRNELDKITAEQQHPQTQHFQLFLDHVVAGLLEGFPEPPQIDMATGRVSLPDWRLDEKKLREQLVLAYRFLLAKYQIYPEYDQFAPADRAALESLVKIALLCGAQVRAEWFDGMAVDLNATTAAAVWKTPIAQALRHLQARAEAGVEWTVAATPGEQQLPGPWIVKIPPPKPKEKDPPKKKPEDDAVQRVEIILRPK